MDKEFNEKKTTKKSKARKFKSPPPIFEQEMTPQLKRRNANFGEVMRGMNTSELTEILGGVPLVGKKDAKKNHPPAKKRNFLNKIRNIEKNADLIHKQLQALSSPSDEKRKEELQQNLINLYVALDGFRNNSACKRYVEKINFVAKKIKGYAETNKFNLPKTPKEQEEEDIEATDTEQETLLKEPVVQLISL